ncbi:hypothetical protein [Paractinoplanes brasiliensis]|uniref:Uncharacterized protein n=1 Tax=Paractinoplanes brasiliensis TaxID=52695 RepID=A0A4R6JR27_9ACTN|nr:hypothetical protein [Actinoplanes brasiliensis]TDO37095.1 hypothetical protein C8E87_0690 [Actinoplanes brasiliensis]GID32211.1 hypothetical protein Abr02nite_71940 [Actinoplanes brasiliensis]
MSPPEGHVWVDPDGLKRAGEEYERHAVYYDHQLRNVQGLRLMYDGCWGDDDMGREFARSFLAGLDGAEAVLKGSHAHVRYAADSLKESSGDFADTEDDAVDAGGRLITMAEPGTPPPATPGPQPATTPGAPPPPSGATENAIPSEYFGTPQTPASPVQGGPANLSLNADPTSNTTPLTMHDGEKVTPGPDGSIPSEHFGEPQTPATPAQGGPNHLSLNAEPPQRSPYEGEVQAPVYDPAPLEPGQMPSTSDVRTPVGGATPEVPDPYLNGHPVDEGFRLVALTPEPDGSVVYDANRYDSVTPVPRSAVSDSAGQPIPGDGLRFFLVQDNPLGDPEAPGYRSLPISVQPPAG